MTVQTDSTYRPRPDGGGGATARLPANQRVATIAGDDLRAVDVVASEALRVLDVADCAPGVHVRLIGGGVPELLLAPSQGDGLVLHASLHGSPAELLITGLVDTVTLSWLGDGGERELRISPRGGKRPFRGAFIGHAGRLPDLVDAELVALVGGRPDPNDLRDLAPRQLHLVDVDGAAELNLAFSLDGLLLCRTAIASLKAPSVGYLRTERCPALATIDADGEHATLIDTGHGDRLDVLGRWACMELRRIHAAAIRVPTVKRLRIREAGGLQCIQTLSIGASQTPIRVDVDGPQAPRLRGTGELQLRPMTGADIQAAFAGGPDASGDGMVRWAEGCTDPGELWLALEVLGACIDAGYDAVDAWQSRCVLHDRRHAGGWSWPFPADLADRGWRADLLLWLRCVAARVPAAVAFARVMAGCERPTQVVALLLCAGDAGVGAAQRSLLLHIAGRAMQRAMAVGMRQDWCASDREFVGLSPRDVTLLQQGARALLAGKARGDSAVDGALSTYCQYVARCAPTTEGVRILGRLYARGVEAGRDGLTLVRLALPERAELNVDERVLLGRAVVRQLIRGAGRSAHHAKPDQGTASSPQPSATR